MTKPGNFIVFEGIDGSGKSTQIQLLADRLRQRDISYYMTMEPTYSPIGSVVHQILAGRVKTDNRVLAALCAADRLDHLLNETDGIAGKVSDGYTVLSDRYYFSSYAYQGVDMSMDWIIHTNEQSSAILKPTVHIFIDIDADTAMERITKNRFHQELFEKKSRLQKVRENYLEAFEKLKTSETVLIVDGKKSVEEISEQIWMGVEKYFV